MSELSLLMLLGGLLGCGASETSTGTSLGRSSGPPTGGGTTSDGAGPASGSPTVSGNGSGGSQMQPGTLTAGTWDDNLNFDYYLKYVKSIEAQQLRGLPLVPRAGRLEILVTDASGAPVAGATVGIAGPAGQLFESLSHPDGRVVFLPGWAGALAGQELRISATLGNATAIATARVGDNNVSLALGGLTAAGTAALDLALVIDTTGSMGDEINYLKAELASIAARIATAFPGVATRWALVVYRDEGDAYVVRQFDFTTSLATFRGQLGAQSADGGGDYPEAPERALDQVTRLGWSKGAAARIAFWVADAPHHAGHEAQLLTALSSATRQGISIYPIAASGVDALTEFSMRTAAQVTAGRYVFLTDDSGIGNAHLEPTIPCYLVTTLDKAMLRMISMELGGTDLQPAPTDIIRTGGDPKNGRCTLSSGEQVVPL